MAPSTISAKPVATAIATLISIDTLTILPSISRQPGFASSGRFTRHGWRVHAYIDFLALAATTGKLAAKKKEERSGHDDHKDHQYGHYCSAVTTTTIIVSHTIDPPLCADDSHLMSDVTVFGDRFQSG